MADQTLPAGKYSIGRSQETSGDTVLQIRSNDGQSTTNRFSIPIVSFKTKSRGELIFHRYGDQYFLSEVWPAGGGTGRAFLKTRTERDLEKSARDNKVAAVKAPKAEVITLVAAQQ